MLISTNSLVNMHPAEVNILEALREFHPSSDPVQGPELDVLHDLMYGCALLEWNSTQGISAKAWRTITTSYEVCDGPCHKVRSFDGHSLHHDAEGVPNCTVQPPASEKGKVREEPTSSKGKGRAVV